MPEPQTNMLDVDFDRVLSTLHGWLGEEVSFGVEVTAQPLEVAHLKGALSAAQDVADPYDHNEFEFRVSANAGFAIRRDYFHGANLFPDAGRLLVSLYDDFEDRDERATVIVHIVGPPLG
jgi:hypothetical protein